MYIEHKNTPLNWGSLDLGLFGIQQDWENRPLDVPAAFGLGIDHGSFWFVATRLKPATIHPDARPGQFTPELWKYDVAEFFIRHPKSGRYLEFNLAPNGAWWSAEFTAPRERAHAEDLPVPGVKTYSELSPDGTWLAAASIPLEVLQARFDFGPETEMNVTFIVDTPEQRFLTATPPPQGIEPNFHHPELFQKVQIIEGGLNLPETPKA